MVREKTKVSEKSTVNMNVKTSLLKQIRQQNPEMADMKATQIVNFILRTWIKTREKWMRTGEETEP